jgi:hypothetical protein
MTRSLRVAFLGLSLGFLVAVGWGVVHGNVHGVSTLLAPGIAGLAVTAVLALVVGIREGAARRREEEPAPVTPPTAGRGSPGAQPGAPAKAATPVVAVADPAAARIAVLEARLALEQEQLDTATIALAEADLMATHGPTIAPDAPVDPAAVAAEPRLRQELLETLVQLIEAPQGAGAPRGEPGSPVAEPHPRVR